MSELKGYQKKYLRGMAHSLKPAAYVGQKGITESLIQSIDDALTCHELIKVKFIEFKEKGQKTTIADAVADRTGCEMIGMIGHVALFFRQNADPKRRKITLP